MSGENGGSKVPSDGCNAVRKHGDDAAEADSSNARFTVTVYTCRFFLSNDTAVILISVEVPARFSFSRLTLTEPSSPALA